MRPEWLIAARISHAQSPTKAWYPDPAEEGMSFGILAQFFSFAGYFEANFDVISGPFLVLWPRPFGLWGHSFLCISALPNVRGVQTAQNGHKTGQKHVLGFQLVPGHNRKNDNIVGPLFTLSPLPKRLRLKGFWHRRASKTARLGRKRG